MVTRNWYNFFKSYRGARRIEGGITEWNGTKNYAGWYNTSSSSFANTITFRDAAVRFATGTGNEGIVLGSGRTPATIDDYKLESMITSGLSASATRSYDEDNDTIYVLTITNTSNEDITIGEIGCVGIVHIGENNSGTKYVLTERTVLDSPVTIPAGGIGKVEYRIKMIIPED